MTLVKHKTEIGVPDKEPNQIHLLEKWIDFSDVGSFETYVGRIKEWLDCSNKNVNGISLPSSYKIFTGNSSIEDILEKVGFTKKTPFPTKIADEALSLDYNGPFEPDAGYDVLSTSFELSGSGVRGVLTRTTPSHTEQLGVDKMNKLCGINNKDSFDLYAAIKAQRRAVSRDGPNSFTQAVEKPDKYFFNPIPVSVQFRYGSVAKERVDRLVEVAKVTVQLLDYMRETPSIFLLHYGTVTRAIDNLEDIRAK